MGAVLRAPSTTLPASLLLDDLEDPLPRHPEEGGHRLEMVPQRVLPQLHEEFRGDRVSSHGGLLSRWTAGPGPPLDQVLLLLGRDQDMLLSGVKAVQGELEELTDTDSGLPQNPRTINPPDSDHRILAVAVAFVAGETRRPLLR